MSYKITSSLKEAMQEREELKQNVRALKERARKIVTSPEYDQMCKEDANYKAEANYVLRRLKELDIKLNN